MKQNLNSARNRRSSNGKKIILQRPNPECVPPELLEKGDVSVEEDCRADIFACGVLFHALLEYSEENGLNLFHSKYVYTVLRIPDPILHIVC